MGKKEGREGREGRETGVEYQSEGKGDGGGGGEWRREAEREL